LERIASAERDRRAGRPEMAIASLGEGAEWPARVVHALSLLSQEEGAEARAILEGALDSWAEELGLAPLAPAEAAPAKAVPDEASPDEDEEDASLDVTEDLAMSAPPVVDSLEAPIAHDELERAFAEAEAQTEEMHDVNHVAERVLLDEPTGLAELSGEVLGLLEPAATVDADPFDVSGDELALETGSLEEVLEIDAATADGPSWPGVEVGDRRLAEPLSLAEPPSLVETSMALGDSFESSAKVAGDDSDRQRILATLEQWLDHLETRRQGRPGRAR
jgi:hypothetical protein